MLKIRLMRIGGKKKPFYRVVVVEERSKRTGYYIELLGTYNPLTEPKDIKLKQDRIDHWIKQGAQMSTGFLRIIGKAPQRLPRKPKKENKQGSAGGQEKPAEKPAEEIKTEEAKPVEEVKAEETPEQETKPAEENAQPEPESNTAEIKAETPSQEKQGENNEGVA